MATSESVKTSGSFTMSRHGEDRRVVVSAFRGFIDDRIFPELMDRLSMVCKEPSDVAYWFVDAVAMTGFSPKIVKPAGEALAFFRSRGGRRLILAAPLPGVRMIARALGLPARVSIEAFEDLPAAQDALRRVLAEAVR